MKHSAELQTDPLLGSTIDGKYRIDEQIGRGGMGAVYKATHIHLNRTVAIKLLRRSIAADDDGEFIKRFTREAQTSSKIHHPSAISIFDFGMEGDLPYLVMEYCEGESLKRVLQQTGKFPVSRMLAIMQQVCGAIEEAHANGVIHRDLKPDNIIF